MLLLVMLVTLFCPDSNILKRNNTRWILMYSTLEFSLKVNGNLSSFHGCEHIYKYKDKMTLL